MSVPTDAAALQLDLPGGWTAGVLSDYIERPEYGYTDSATDDTTGTKFLRITDIQGGQVDWPTVPYCHCGPDVLATKRLIPGDVVVARIGATTGKSFYIDATPREAVFASYLIRLRAKPEKLLPRYLYFYMQSAEYWAHVNMYKGDRLKGGVNIQVLESLPVVVPPPHVQAQIVSVLDLVEAAARSEAARIAQATELQQATMSALFECGLRGESQKETDLGSMPASWKLEPLNMHHTVVSGGTPSRGNPAFWSGGDIPWVKTTEVNYGVISETDEHITQEGLERSAAKLLPAGTVLIAMYGQGVTRGRVAILGIDAACNQACAAINPTDDAVLPSYVYHFLSWRYESIRALAHGGQQQNLNLEIVRDLPVAYPASRAEQQDIVNVLEALDHKIAIHQRKRIVFENLLHALLQQLLAGELPVSDLDLSDISRPTSSTTEDDGVLA